MKEKLIVDKCDEEIEEDVDEGNLWTVDKNKVKARK